MLRKLLPILLGGCLVPDPVVDAYLDQDNDGYATVESPRGDGTDCDDANPDVHPGAEEVCGDGIDNDCINGIDGPDAIDAVAYRPDDDGDGFGGAEIVLSCTPLEGFVVDDGAVDCDDEAPNTYPNAEDICANGLDEDCDGEPDNGPNQLNWWPDADGDGWGARVTPDIRCDVPDGYARQTGDCLDNNGAAYPGARDEWYDGVDSDCDGADDFDADLDGSLHPDDCDDFDPTIRPGLVDSWYDGIDSNCDGADDFDADADGSPHPADCNDNDPEVGPASTEIPNNIVDEDCDGIAAQDADFDGYAATEDCDDGDPHVWVSCNQCDDADADGAWVGCDDFIDRVVDCDDLDVHVFPGAEERVGDGVDQDCDGLDISLENGIFISAVDGEDQENCGLWHTPCATLPYADARLDPDLPLILTEGEYAGTWTHRDVHGGYNADWSPGATTILTDDPSRIGTPEEFGILVLTGTDQSVTGITLEWRNHIPNATGLFSIADTVYVADVVVDATGLETEYCQPIGLEGSSALVERVTLLGCAATGESIGINLAVDQFTLRDIDVRMPGGGLESFAIRTRNGVGEIARASIDLRGDLPTGIRVQGDSTLSQVVVSDVHVTCDGLEAIGLETLGNTELTLASSRLEAIGDQSNGIYMQQYAGNSALTVISTQFELGGTDTIGARLDGGEGSLDLQHVTMIGPGTGTVIHVGNGQTGGLISATASVFQGFTGLAVDADTPVREPARFDQCHVDAICDGPCLTGPDVDAIAGSANNQAGDARLVLLDGVWSPEASSPLIDVVAAPQSVLDWPDAAGESRLQGVRSDLGAVEHVP